MSRSLFSSHFLLSQSSSFEQKKEPFLLLLKREIIRLSAYTTTGHPRLKKRDIFFDHELGMELTRCQVNIDFSLLPKLPLRIVVAAKNGDEWRRFSILEVSLEACHARQIIGVCRVIMIIRATLGRPKERTDLQTGWGDLLPEAEGLPTKRVALPTCLRGGGEGGRALVIIYFTQRQCLRGQKNGGSQKCKLVHSSVTSIDKCSPH